MKYPALDLEALLAVVTATVDASGRLIDANQGFRRLIAAGEAEPPGKLVAPYFIQPDFATLVKVPAGPDGEVYRGLLTIGEYMGLTRSLRGRVWRVDEQLRLQAEFDIEELERVCATTLELNRDYANAQITLAQANLTLQQRETRLQQLVAELSVANAERKLAQDRLQQAEKLASLGFLAAGAAHEINNPLGFINSNLGTLGEYLQSLLQIIDAYDNAAPAGTPEHEQFAVVATLKKQHDLDFIKNDFGILLAESRQGLERVKRIVSALKDFAAVESAGAWRADDINGGLDSTLSLLTNELRHCEVRQEFGALPPVPCVMPQLKRVFMNLLLNAAQAIPGDGVITIRTGCTDNEVWIAISDSGHGIPTDLLPHIFDPFCTTKAVGQGSGLGLSVSYGIIASHHGRIEVESTVGQGSTFRVWLPASC